VVGNSPSIFTRDQRLRLWRSPAHTRRLVKVHGDCACLVVVLGAQALELLGGTPELWRRSKESAKPSVKNPGGRAQHRAMLVSISTMIV
jgi:hypothetical protein